MSVTIQWIKGVTEANSCKIKNLDTVHAKPCNTICSRLVVVTDKNDKLHKSGTIYHIQCHDCHHAYVHEMGRKLKTKIGRTWKGVLVSGGTSAEQQTSSAGRFHHLGP